MGMEKLRIVPTDVAFTCQLPLAVRRSEGGCDLDHRQLRGGVDIEARRLRLEFEQNELASPERFFQQRYAGDISQRQLLNGALLLV
jgi:hypothetical protein